MSYILDALRKSDEERKKRQEQQRTYSPYSGTGRATRKNRRTAGLILSASLLVVICLLAGGWWLSNRQQHSKLLQPGIATPGDVKQIQPQPERKSQAATEPGPANPLPKTGSAAEEIAPSPASGFAELSRQNVPISDGAASQTAQSQEPAGTEIPLMAELPFTIQAQLPEMNFSGHAFSTAPELRLIMINNAVVREGAMIDTDLYLEEITESGLIMNYRGTRFRIELF